LVSVSSGASLPFVPRMMPAATSLAVLAFAWADKVSLSDGL